MIGSACEKLRRLGTADSERAMNPSNRDPKTFQLEQVLSAAEQYESELAREGSIPDLQKLPLRRLRRPLEWVGGVLVAAILGFLAIWAVHFALNTYLHYGAG